MVLSQNLIDFCTVWIRVNVSNRRKINNLTDVSRSKAQVARLNVSEPHLRMPLKCENEIFKVECTVKNPADNARVNFDFNSLKLLRIV